MDNLTFITLPNFDGTEVEHAIIAREDGSFTSMAKSTYDEMITKSEAKTL
jgi:hypothetical protein